MADHNGSLKNLFPPKSNGTETGTGTILGDNEVTYPFDTPTANNDQELTVDKPITFTLDEEGRVLTVTQDE